MVINLTYLLTRDSLEETTLRITLRGHFEKLLPEATSWSHFDFEESF